MDFFNDPLALFRAGTNLDVSGQLIGAMGNIVYANQARQAGEYQAEQLRVNAGQMLAVGQHDAENVDRQTRLIASRALAVAAASGGGASDPGVVNTISDIAAEGAYRRALAIYHGESSARVLNMDADAAVFGSKNQANAARLSAVGGVMGAGATRLKGKAQERRMAVSLAGGMGPTLSLRQKYGGDGPSNMVNSEDSPDDWTRGVY
jgi:hypothetical protein